MSIQECQRSNTSSEFTELLAFIQKRDWDTDDKSDHYLAMIVAEVRAIRDGFSKTPKGVNLKDCLLGGKFKGGPPEKEPEPGEVEEEKIPIRGGRTQRDSSPPKEPAKTEPGTLDLSIPDLKPDEVPPPLADPEDEMRKREVIAASLKKVWAQRLGAPVEGD